MEFAFLFTVFFMLFGPIKLIPLFAGVTRGADTSYKRSAAVWATVIASVVCVFVVMAGETLLSRYRISIEAVRLAGGLVLLISALQVIFKKAQNPDPDSVTHPAIQLAASPVALPGMVPPAGVAVILVGTILSPEIPGLMQNLVICLAIMMVLDFLVLFFIDKVMKIPGLMLILLVLGSVLIFVQASWAIQIMLVALKNLGVVQA
jgi:multiple antibiotic resistance protein